MNNGERYHIQQPRNNLLYSHRDTTFCTIGMEQPQKTNVLVHTRHHFCTFEVQRARKQMFQCTHRHHILCIHRHYSRFNKRENKRSSAYTDTIFAHSRLDKRDNKCSSAYTHITVLTQLITHCTQTDTEAARPCHQVIPSDVKQASCKYTHTGR